AREGAPSAGLEATCALSGKIAQTTAPIPSDHGLGTTPTVQINIAKTASTAGTAVFHFLKAHDLTATVATAVTGCPAAIESVRAVTAGTNKEANMVIKNARLYKGQYSHAATASDPNADEDYGSPPVVGQGGNAYNSTNARGVRQQPTDSDMTAGNAASSGP